MSTAVRGLFGAGRADDDLAHGFVASASGIVGFPDPPIFVELVGLLSERVLPLSRLNNLSDCGSIGGNDSTTHLASVHS
jgi:hypothetical protein